LTTGNIFIFNGVPLPWSSKKKCVTLSIAKSDYISANLAAKKIVWQRLFCLKSEANRKVQTLSSVITSQQFDWSTISPIKEPSTFFKNQISSHTTNADTSGNKHSVVPNKNQLVDPLTKNLDKTISIKKNIGMCYFHVPCLNEI
jgi:hypothetical protein